ncbi:MAG: ABC transporter ATP-binding protein [Lentisphaerae bacterium]|nr:MAG: ABC transporter ATP-binding protein [Lentisphaerota bacterium]
MTEEYAIKTENLTKYYRLSWFRRAPHPALSNLNLEVPRRCVFGFLGPNGAGKTTTIRCLMDLIRPTSGRAWVLGKPCGNIRIREKIGYLPDSPAFGTHLTPRQFLSICARLLKLHGEERNKRIDNVLEMVHMREHADEAMSGFSRGMLQRIGIAQAMLNLPQLLILDEPLVGLDPEGRHELLSIIRERKEDGVCVFFCSHILSDVESLCDQVGILRKGELQIAGRLKDLLQENGVVVKIPPHQEDAAKDLLPLADSSHRGEGGLLILEVMQPENVERIRAQELPDGIEIAPRKEKLEDLFFRITKGTARKDETTALE